MDISSIYSQELQAFVQDHLSEDPAQMILKYAGNSPLDIKAAAAQIGARQKSAKKLPVWSKNPSIIFPPSLSLEQCSSQSTALFKSQLVQGHSFADLTGGFGVDTYYIGCGFDTICYVEKQKPLFQIAKHNLKHLLPTKKIQFVNGEGIAFLQENDQKFDLIYVDPARRGLGNQKLHELTLTEPDVVTHWELLRQKASAVMVKASPMLDVQAAMNQLSPLTSIYILAHRHEVKELLLLSVENQESVNPEINVVELGLSNRPLFSFTREEELNNLLRVGPLGRFLIIPHPGIVKAGGFNTFSERFGLEKLHANTQIYTSNGLPHKELPGKVFEVMRELSLVKKQIRKEFPSGIVNVISKNHPLKAEACKHKFNLKDGGDDYLVLLTDFENSGRALKCRLVEKNSLPQFHHLSSKH